MAPSISDQCRSCIISLQEIISILSQPDCNDHHVKPSQVCEELDRFSLFIGNIGALHRPESPLSIESRLQDANDVLTHILGLLADLNDVTAELLDIVSGKREGMVTIADEAEEDSEVISEANELREEITETITRLFRVSILIRQAAPTDIFAKALSRNRYHFSDQFDIAHVGEKYRKLATADYAWLRQRLGRAITQRRHYLCYIQDHREKLGGITNHHDKADSSAAKSQTPAVKQPLGPKPILDAESRPSFFTKATTVAAERITPQLHVAGDSDPEEDARSYTTVSRSIDGDHESSANFRIPKLDTLRADHKNEFECPFCFRIKKFKSERIWRKHVFSDLRPYVCTFPDCDAPYFSDINKWFHHEMTYHRVTYNCFLCQKVYYQEEKYLSHLRQEHGDTLDDGGMQVGADLARKPLAQIPASDCPCCSDWANRLEERIIHTSGSAPTGILAVTPTVFKRHLAAHLEQLALFAVPIAAATDETKDSNAAIEETRSRRTDISQVSALTFPSLPGNFDDSSSEKETDPSNDIISPSDTPARPIGREYAIKHTNSLSSDSGESTDRDSSAKTLMTLNRGSELQTMIESNRVALGDDHPDTLASMKKLALYYEEQERWEDAQDVLFHVMILTSKKLGGSHPDTLASMKDLVLCYEKQQKWKEAGELLMQVIEISKTTLGHDHPETLAGMQRMTSIHMSQDRWEAAGILFAQMLEINKTKLGEKHDDTLANMNNLALALRQQKRWDEAKAIHRQIISVLEERLGRNDVTTMEAINGLVLVLKQQGELEEAIILQRELLAGNHMLFGPNDPRTLSIKEQLVYTLEDQGKYDEAEALRREVLTGYEHEFGREHIRTLSSKERLADTLEDQEKYDEADALRREAIKGYENAFNPEHRKILLCKERLADTLEIREKYDEAEALRREAIKGYEHEFGPYDIHTLHCMEELALMLQRLENFDKAEALYRELLAASEKEFGFEGAPTLEHMDTLASLQRKLGKFDEEEILRREALRRYQRAFSHETPETLSALLKLAETLAINEKLEEAETLYRETIRLCKEQLRPGDGIILSAIDALASILESQGKFKEVEDLRREEVVAQEGENGRDHPDTLKKLSTLASTLERHGKLKEAEELYREVCDFKIRADVFSSALAHYVDILTSMETLASVQEKQGRFGAAESTYREVISRFIDTDRKFWAKLDLEIRNKLLRVLEKQGKEQETEDMRRQVLEAQQNLFQAERERQLWHERLQEVGSESESENESENEPEPERWIESERAF